MLEENKDLIMGIVGLMLGLFLFVWILTFSIYKYNVEIGEASIIKVYVEENLVYTGKKAFVGISSGGMTTTATIYKKLYPFNITDRVYSNNNIKVE